MLPRRQRLQRSGFSLLTHGKRASSAHFLVILAPAHGKGGAAAVVPKKVAPKASDRHLLKRRILATLRPVVSLEMALVVHAKRGAHLLSYPALRAELLELLHSLGTKP